MASKNAPKGGKNKDAALDADGPLDLDTDGTLADADPALAEDTSLDDDQPTDDDILTTGSPVDGDSPVDGAQAARDAEDHNDEPHPVTPSSTPRERHVRTLHEDAINAGAERFAQEAKAAFIAASLEGNSVELHIVGDDGDVEDFDGEAALRQHAEDHADDYNPNVDNSTVKREEARLNAELDGDDITDDEDDEE